MHGPMNVNYTILINVNSIFAVIRLKRHCKLDNIPGNPSHVFDRNVGVRVRC
jgi:hypothetical protein